MIDFLEKVLEDDTYVLTRDDIVQVLSLDTSIIMKDLCYVSDIIRQRYCGDDVQIRALLEISNICFRNCNYCGVRRDNTLVNRYKMSIDEILESAYGLSKIGFKTLVMQAGESNAHKSEELAYVIKTIKSNFDMAVTLSLGEHPFEVYKQWKEAGADRYLLRHETANDRLYSYLHPDAVLQTRMDALNSLKELGYQVGAGFMVGSPTQSVSDLADDIEFIRDFQPDMVGIGPFIPHCDTPFKDEKAGGSMDTIRAVALVRIVTKNALLPSTTALATILKDGQKAGLMAGCDVVMINFTPLKYKLLYEIYPDKKCMTEDPNTIIEKTTDMIKSIGRNVSNDRGHSRKIKNQ